MALEGGRNQANDPEFESLSEKDKMKYLADLSNSLIQQLQLVDIVAKPLSVFDHPLTKEGKANDPEFESQYEQDKMKYLADLSNSLIQQLQFVDIVAKPSSVFGRPIAKKGKAAEMGIFPEVTEDNSNPQGGPDSKAGNIQRSIRSDPQGGPDSEASNPVRKGKNGRHIPNDIQSSIRSANAMGEMKRAHNIFLQADHIYQKMIQGGYKKDYVGLPLLASMQSIREWCQKWARQVIQDSKFFRSARQSEMTIMLLNEIKVFFKDVLDPIPHLEMLQGRVPVPKISKDDLNKFVWELLDYADLKKLANYVYDLALEPVQQCAHDEKYLSGIINEIITQIRDLSVSLLHSYAGALYRRGF
jgi:hypothetical protein